MIAESAANGMQFDKVFLICLVTFAVRQPTKNPAIHLRKSSNPKVK